MMIIKGVTVYLGDKLSNIRCIQRDHERLGNELWQRFNQKDPAEHAWYYRSIADVLKEELGNTNAYEGVWEQEYSVNWAFGMDF